tara:strand:- start:864 stop:1088 length:225 start_codon:yes stop_codon:yes gene_type:complete
MAKFKVGKSPHEVRSTLELKAFHILRKAWHDRKNKNVDATVTELMKAMDKYDRGVVWCETAMTDLDSISIVVNK